MPVESFTYITSLNSSNPGGSDGILEGDNHIRGIKAALLNTFTAMDGATTITPAVLNNLQAGSFSGNFAVTGRLTANGACPTGMIADFLSVPADWLELNGQAVSRTTYAALFAIYGTGFGAGDGSTTFNLPNFTDRYRRQRGTFAVNTTLSNQNKTHTHTYSGSSTTGVENQGFTFNFSGTTSGHSNDHSHTTFVSLGGTTSGNGDHAHSYNDQKFIPSSQTSAGGGNFNGVTGEDGRTTGNAGFHDHTWSGSGNFGSGGTSANHTHTFSGTTGTQNNNHNHNFSWSGTTAADGGTETRPDTFVVITCVKT
jgi:hypothetical protein